MASIHKYDAKLRGKTRPVTRWRVRWRDDEDRMRSRSFTTEAAARTFRGNLELGNTDDDATGRPTRPVEAAVALAACVDTWRRTRRVSAQRQAAERSLVKRFGPLLERPVESLAPSDVRTLVAGLTDEGLAAETVSAVLRTLRAVLDTAVEDGHLPANPAARVKPPRIQRPPLDAGDVYTAGEAARLVAHTAPRWRALVAVLVYTGARWSEAAALTRGDVDLMRGRIHLGHRVVEEVSGRCTLRDGGKTRGSDRWVPLPAAARRELADHIATRQPGPGALLFATEKGTPVSRANATKRIYRPAVDAAGYLGRGIPLRNLRHSAASMMLAAGLPPLEVAHRLGHSRPSTTLDVYARFIPRDDTAATDLLDAYLAGS